MMVVRLNVDHITITTGVGIIKGSCQNLSPAILKVRNIIPLVGTLVTVLINIFSYAVSFLTDELRTLFFFGLNMPYEQRKIKWV